MERYEQSQSIVSRIQQILREYPYGDTVLLELLQNADDAGAVSTSIAMEDYAANAHNPAAKSPAVVFTNSSVFTDRDLVNIQSIGGDEHSTKRHDGTKVGRFGIGFNSAYHLTDVISFVSNTTLVVFDPSKENMPPAANGERFGGGRWDFVKAHADAVALQKKGKELSPEQRFVTELLTAYEVSSGGVFSPNAAFKGTIFRLPLREQPTKLWREVHGCAKLRALVEGFHATARLGIVLLKNVASVVGHIRTGPGLTASRRAFAVTAATDATALQQKGRIVTWLQLYTAVMKAVAENSDNHKNPRPPQAFIKELPAPTSIHIDLHVTTSVEHTADSSSCGVPATNTAATHFSVTHQLGPGGGWEFGGQPRACWTIAEECARYHHPISVPWSAAIVENRDAVEGRLLCFFPIKQATGLPIHVHGYFQLSSDRQSVLTVERSKWNHAMCVEVVPHAYLAGVLALTSADPRQPATPYQLWPSRQYTDSTVALVATQTLMMALHRNTILTAKNGLVPCNKATFVKPRLQHPASLRILQQVADNLAVTAQDFLLHGKPPAADRVPDDAASSLDDGPLAQLLDAFLRLGLGQSVYSPGLADSAYFRTQLSKRHALLVQLDSAPKTAAARRPAAAAPPPAAAPPLPIEGLSAVELFCRCTDDENYADFAKCTTLDVLPLHSGKTSRLTPAGSPEPLVYAQNQECYEMARHLHSTKHRLVAFFGAASSETAAVPNPPKHTADPSKVLTIATTTAVHSTTGIAAATAQYTATAAKRIAELVKQSIVAPLTPGEVFWALCSDELDSPAFLSTQIAAQSEASNASLGLEHCFVPAPRLRPDCAVPTAVLVQYCMRHRDDIEATLATLPLLPGTVPKTFQDTTASGKKPLGTSSGGAALPYLAAWSVQEEVCFAVDPADVANPDIQVLQQTLLACGARELSTSIFPLSLLSLWQVDGRHRVSVISTKIARSARDLVAALGRLMDSPTHGAEVSAILQNPRCAPVILQFILKGQADLMVPDCKKVAGFPIFPSIWGTYVPISTEEEDEDDRDEQHMVIRIPSSVSRKIVSLLQAGEIHGTRIIGNDAKDPLLEKFLTSVFPVTEVPGVVAFALAMHRLPPPCPPHANAAGPLSPEQTEANTLWSEFSMLLAQLHRTKGGRSVLFQKAISKLRATPLFSVDVEAPTPAQIVRHADPTATDAAAVPSTLTAPVTTATKRVAPQFCLNVVGLPKATCALIHYLHRSSPVSAATDANGDKLPPGAASATGKVPTSSSSQDSDPAMCVPFLPDLAACFPQREHLHALCEELGLVSTLTGPMLLAMARAFDRIPAARCDLAHSITLLHAIDEANDSGAMQGVPALVAALSTLRFVPVLAASAPSSPLASGKSTPAAAAATVATGAAAADATGPSIVVFVSPADATSQAMYDICPSVGRRPIAPQVFSTPSARTNRHGMPQCCAAFGWSTAPPIKSVLHFIDNCKTAVNGKSVWAAYGYLEQVLELPPQRVTTVSSSDPPNVLLLCHQLIQSNLNGLYFPEDAVFYKLEQLSSSPFAAPLSPFLSCISSVFQQRFPRLVAVLGLPATHPFQTILGAMQCIAEQERDASQEAQVPKGSSNSSGSGAANITPSAFLTQRGRQMLNSALEYLVQAHPADAKAVATTTGVLVPTSDGRFNLSTRVVYDFYAIDDQQASVDTLHGMVHAQTARKLGMLHSGTKVIENLRKAALTGGHSARRAAIQSRGQRLSLLNAIKRILGDYSDPHAVVLEMLQNADDAGAREYKLFLDTRSFSTEQEGLLGKGMQGCQGPALLVYNDKMFAPTDIDALLEIGCGHKSKDQLAIGRFGVGFNSVYHLTDCPALVSGGTTLFLDPSAKLLDAASAESPGLLIEHTDEQRLTKHFPAQFEPFMAAPYNIDFRKGYPGTLFRLPIRTKPSEDSVSSKKWAVGDVRKMLLDFTKMMHKMLIFLKHVAKISIFEVDASGDVALLGQTEIVNAKTVFDFRDELSSYLAIQHPSKPLMPPMLAQTLMTIVFHPGGGQPPEYHDWFVSVAAKSIAAGPVLADCDPVLRRKLIPFGAVAIRLDTAAKGGNNSGGSARTKADMAHIAAFAPFLPDSHAMLYCYLPMPGSSGLPFHVHGCFALSSDRRGMSLSSTVEGKDSWEVQWNKFILADVVPVAVEAAFRLHTPLLKGSATPTLVSNYYNTWPVKRVSGTPHAALVAHGFFNLLVGQGTPCLWGSDKACFVAPGDACVRLVSSSLDADGMRINAGDGGGAGEGASGGSGLPSLSASAAALVLHDEQLCECPPLHFKELLDASKRLSGSGPVELTPHKVLATLIRRVSAVTLPSIPVDLLFPTATSHMQVVHTLAEVVQYLRIPSLMQAAAAVAAAPDSDDSAVLLLPQGAPVAATAQQQQGGRKAPALFGENCPLVLLDERQVGIVKPSRLFVTPDCRRYVQALFPKFLSTVVDPDYHRVLKDKGFTPWMFEELGVSPLRLENVSKLLATFASQYIRPDELGRSLDWDGRYDSERGQWLFEVWNFLATTVDRMKRTLDEDLLKTCDTLAAWPLIPTQRDRQTVLIPLSEAKLVVHGNVDQSLSEALVHLGVWTLDPRCPFTDVVQRVCKIEDVKGQNVAQVLQSAEQKGRFAKMHAAQRDQLLTWLLQQNKAQQGNVFQRMVGLGNSNMNSLILSLPLFEMYGKATKSWKYAPGTVGAVALPSGVPVSDAADGMYRKPVEELQLRVMPMDEYFGKKVLPLLTVAHGGLSMLEELQHLRIVGQDRALRQALQAHLRSARFIPADRVATSRPAAGHPGSPRARLKGLLVDYVIEAKIDFRRACAANDGLLLRLQEREAESLDAKNRFAASDLLCPATCTTAALPDVLGMLMTANRPCFTKVFVSSLLWADPYIREVLKTAGVEETMPDASLQQTALAFQECVQDRNLFRNLILASGRVICTAAGLRQLMQEISLSIGQVALRFGSPKGIEAMGAMKFLISTPSEDLPFQFAPDALPRAANPFAASSSPSSSSPQPYHPVLYQPSEMAPDKFALVCWTQIPIAAKQLDCLPLVKKPPFAMVLAHLTRIVMDAAKLAPGLVDRAVRATYQYLVKHCADELRPAGPQLLGMPLLMLPPSAAARSLRFQQDMTGGGGSTGSGPSHEAAVSPTAPPPPPVFIAMKCVLHAPRIGLLEPFFYQFDDFIETPETFSFIRQVSSLELPRPQDVLSMLFTSAARYDCLVANPHSSFDVRTHAIHVHAELLKLLVLAAEERNVRLLIHPPADPIGAGASSSQNQRAGPAGSPKRVVMLDLDSTISSARARLGASTVIETEDISQIRLPTMQLAMASIGDVVAPDAPHLVRRLRKGALHLAHQSIPLYTLRMLGVTSIVSVVAEAPIHLVELPTQDGRQTHVNTFLASHPFARGLLRILASERRDESARSHLVATSGGGASKLPLLTADERRLLQTLQVRFVQRALVAIVDQRTPTVNIGAESETRESPSSCFDKRKNMIYVCVGGGGGEGSGGSGGQASVVVDAFFLLALEVNKLLGNRIRNLAPLACILKHAMEHPGHTERTGLLLDAFGCSELSTGAAVPGDPVSDAVLVSHGLCPLPGLLATSPVGPSAASTQRLVATVHPETSLVTWRLQAELLKAILTGGVGTARSDIVVVEFPVIF